MKKAKLFGILGVAEIRVWGKYPEKFINLSSAKGVRMWDTVVKSEELEFKADIASLKKLEEIQHKLGFIMEVQKKSGLFVFAQFLLKRKLLLVGFFCFWLALYFLAGMVWQLDIHGVERLDKSEVLEYIEGLGLERWARIREIPFNEIEQQLYVRFPEIAWVAVERSGTRISVRIVEKEQDPLQFGEPIDIVAEYDGIISEMIVLQGVSLVEPGMTVAKGDVLISGYRQDDTLVNAAGSVKAIVYIEGYGEAALEEVLKEYTGNEFMVQILQLGSANISISRSKHGFEHYDVVESVRFFRGNSAYPIRLVLRKFKEVNLTKQTFTPDQARELAQERATLLAHQQVNEHADIIKIETKDITMDKIFRYKVTLTIETKIGLERVQIRGEELVE